MVASDFPDLESVPQPGDVQRVMYASLSNVHGSIFTEMEHIREAAVRNNAPLQVSTALLYQSGWFLQWKEGPAPALESIMKRVATDPRHHSLRVVHHSSGERILPDVWSMAIVQASEKPTDFARRVMALRDEFAQGAQYSPATVWRRLSTPMEHPGSRQQHDPDLFRRVMVCAAGSDASFELVRWLAASRGEPVVHRRFAGIQHLDVGTDYVDCVDAGHVVRLIAMARNGLLFGLTRAFMADYSHLVLIFSGDAERDEELLMRVVSACAGARHVPVLLGVGLSPQSHQQIAATANGHGLVYRVCPVMDGYAHEEIWNTVLTHIERDAPAASSVWPVLLKQYA